MASPGPEKLYLLVEKYRGSDEEYLVYFDLNTALVDARHLADQCRQEWENPPYGDRTAYAHEPNGAFEFIEYGEDSWMIAVVGIPVNYEVTRICATCGNPEVPHNLRHPFVPKAHAAEE